MGGERENFVSKKATEPQTQGSVAGSVAGQRIRFHENAGQVHFHDDNLGLKAAIPVAEWWKAWEKLRTSPARWEWFDTTNKTLLVIETQIVGEPPGIEAAIDLTLANFGTNFTALNAFTKRK